MLRPDPTSAALAVILGSHSMVLLNTFGSASPLRLPTTSRKDQEEGENRLHIEGFPCLVWPAFEGVEEDVDGLGFCFCLLLDSSI